MEVTTCLRGWLGYFQRLSSFVLGKALNRGCAADFALMGNDRVGLYDTFYDRCRKGLVNVTGVSQRP
jgi:hypothetical protein